MKKSLLSCIALLLVFSMLVTGCAGKPQTEDPSPVETEAPKADNQEVQDDTQKETQEEPKELVTLEVFAGNAGLLENVWWTEMLERDLGIKLQSVGTDGEVLNAYIAGGDLPDIVRFNTMDTAQLAYEAGLLLDLDTKKDLLPNLFNNYPEGSLQFQRDKYEDGGLYTAPVGASTDATTFGLEEYGLRVDFPYFQEYCDANGEPELKDIEDFIPVLKWIQEKHPTNEEGQPAYGITIFGSWDGKTVQLASYIAQKYGVKQAGYNEINMDTLERKSVFDDDSYYKRALKFLFTAMQEGILDPDSITQTWDDYQMKFESRRCYSSLGYTYVQENARMIPFENMHLTSSNAAPQLGNSNGVWGIGINAKSENVDKVCEFLNYIMDEENWWEMRLGPKGEFWDLNDEGQPYVTEFGYEMLADSNVKFSTGGNINDGNSIYMWNWRPLANYHVFSQYGVTADYKSWPTAAEETKNEVTKAWENWLVKTQGLKHPGGEITEAYVVSELGMSCENRSGSSGVVEPEALTELGGRLRAAVVPMSWEMIYASSEDEFESIWDAMVEQVTEMGVEEYNDWYYDDYIAGIEKYEKYCY